MSSENILRPNSLITGTLKWKTFVNAKPLSQDVKSQSKKGVIAGASQESGSDVSNHYLNVINERRETSNDSDEVFICKEVSNSRKQKLSKKKCISNEIATTKALKFAQFDDLENLKKQIHNGVSINATDEYGWSLLMVASCGGSEKVVKYLLSKGARRGRRDCKGNTALYLASKNNHTNIVNLLIKNSKSEENDLTAINICTDNSNQVAYCCKKCKFTTSCSKRKHETSIVHLLKTGRFNMKPIYGIPRSNKGFQMLLRQGWDDTKGLGPHGSGKKYPIKTKQKKDRLGVGHTDVRKSEASKSDVKKHKQQISNLKEAKQLRSNDKQNEINIRRILNEPDSELVTN